MQFHKREPHIFEEIDDFNFKGKKFKRFLRDLKFINTYLGSNPAIVSAIMTVVKEKNLDEIKIVDIGSGGGDLLLAIAKKLQKENLKVELIGVDINNNCIEYAKEQTKNFNNISYLKVNIHDDNFKIPTCDILVSSHFIDHLEDDKIISFIKKVSPLVKYKILITEAERIPFIYYLFKYTGFMFYSRITIRDCLMAIRRAFKKEEFEELLYKNNIINFTIKRIWAFHLLLTIETK